VESLPLTKDKYQEWDNFCLFSPDGWFWHTTNWLEYTLEYILDSISVSFLVTENKQILAICPLILKDNEFQMFWSPAFADLPDKKKERVINFTFEQIDRLAKENNVKRVSFMIYPLSFPRYNYLMKQGYIDISINTQVIDLRQDLRIIHGAMRKGHDYDTDRGLKELGVNIWDKDNIDGGIFSQYCELHHKDAGKVTRPKTTFNMQLDWIKQGNAILVGAFTNKPDKYIGFSYIFTYKNKAYYGSACSEPSYSNLPIGHVLTWKTIEWLKEHGFQYYELGWQQYFPQPYDFPSKKEIEISFFKRGFGGLTIPLFRGEKYYNADFYFRVNLSRIHSYAEYLRNNNAKGRR